MTTTPEQKKRLLKAKIAVALQDELGPVSHSSAVVTWRVSPRSNRQKPRPSAASADIV